jgi:hypothetical protein
VESSVLLRIEVTARVSHFNWEWSRRSYEGFHSEFLGYEKAQSILSQILMNCDLPSDSWKGR